LNGGRKDEVVKKNCKAIFLFDEVFPLFTHVKRELKKKKKQKKTCLFGWVKKYFLTQKLKFFFTTLPFLSPIFTLFAMFDVL